jgi:hypothetical protein
MGETWQGLIMDSVVNLLSSSTPTHTHDLDNHSIGHGCSKTQRSCGVLAASQKSNLSIGFATQKQFRNLERITIFKIVVLLIRLGSLIICTHYLIALTKTKESNLLMQIARI